MKATELMTGDLVRVSKDVCYKKGTIVKIHGIDADHVFPEKGLKGVASCMQVNDPDGCTSGVWLDYLEPIPLTAEILEQNGFKKKGHRYGIYDDYFDFEIYEYNDGTWIVTYHCCEMSLPDEQLLVCYVHQLQHFMRHCAIEKELRL